jgi:DNA-binding IclR family transcriptional regulator
MERQQRGVQSIEVGGQLLRALVDQGKPMALRDLANSADMPPAKAHPYLVSFAKIGLVEQDASSGLYALGPLALRLGLACLENLTPVRAALPLVAGLSNEIEQTVTIAIWGSHGPMVVRIEESSHPVRVNMRIGAVMSLLTTATGQLFAAYLPPRLVEDLIMEELMRTQPQHARRASLKHNEESLAEIRRRSLARTLGQPIPGINAFSAPVFDRTGSIVLAITAMGPSGTFNEAWNGSIAKAVAARAALVSRQLGYRT